MPEKAKNKTGLQQRVSLRITFSKIILLQSDTKTLNITFKLFKMTEPKMPRIRPKTKQT